MLVLWFDTDMLLYIIAILEMERMVLLTGQTHQTLPRERMERLL